MIANPLSEIQLDSVKKVPDAGREQLQLLNCATPGDVEDAPPPSVTIKNILLIRIRRSDVEIDDGRRRTERPASNIRVAVSGCAHAIVAGVVSRCPAALGTRSSQAERPR